MEYITSYQREMRERSLKKIKRNHEEALKKQNKMNAQNKKKSRYIPYKNKLVKISGRANID